MKTLINRRRAQPFRDYLDSPSWLEEEEEISLPRIVTVYRWLRDRWLWMKWFSWQ